MATTVTFNGNTYQVPAVGAARTWGTSLSNYLIAISTGALQKSGGTFTLTADIDFGATYGLKAAYYKSRNANPASTGKVRLGNGEQIAWRNNANTDNLLLEGGNDDNLIFTANGGTPKRVFAAVFGSANEVAKINSAGTAYEVGKIVNANIDSSAAIDDSKLATISSSGKVSNSATTATSSNTASAIVARDASGNFLSGTINGTTIPSTKTLVVTTDKLSALAATTSAELAGVISDKTGSGSLVFGTSPTLTTPVIASITPVNGVTSVSGTGAVGLPTGTTAQRPTPATGHIRHNSDTGEFEGYTNSAWQSIGGGLNERPVKNYYKLYAQATVAPGTLSTLASTTSNITISGTTYAATSAFYADSTSGSAALTQDTNNVLSGSNSYLSALSGANTNGSVFFQLPAFCLSASDVGKPTSISFDIKSSLADGDYDVVVVRYTVSSTTGTHASIISVAGNASSASVTPSAKLPTGTTKFQGFFIPDSTTSTDVYAVRIRRLVGSQQIYIDSLYVGPDSVVQGAAVSDWQSFTPTLYASTSNPTLTTQSGFWRRNGSDVEMGVTIVASAIGNGTYYINLPNSLAPDFSKMPVSGTDGGIGFGNGYLVTNTTTRMELVPATSNGAPYLNGILFLKYNGVALSSADCVGTTTLCVYAKVPVVGWSSNTTIANRAVEEYASNDGSGGTTANTTYTTGGVYGASGSNIVAVSSASGGYVLTRYKVTFQTPIQPTDTLKLEIQAGGTGAWVPVESSAYIPRINGTGYVMGMRLEKNDSTSVYVGFGNAGAYSTSATYDAAGSAWSGETSNKWRVRKISGGAVVGYPISSRNIVGDTSGTTVPAGVVGEKITWTSAPGDQATSTSEADWTNATISLTAGTWQIFASIQLKYTTGTTAGDYGYTYAKITNSSNTTVDNCEQMVETYNRTSGAGAAIISSVFLTTVQNITSTTTYKIRACHANGAGTGSGNILNSGLNYAKFYAIRIA